MKIFQTSIITLALFFIPSIADENFYEQVNAKEGLVVGEDEKGNHVNQSHEMQINTTSTKTPLMIQGGSSSIEFWKSTETDSPDKAGSIGLAKPGQNSGDDVVISTYNPSSGWKEKVTVKNNGEVETSGPINAGGNDNSAIKWKVIKGNIYTESRSIGIEFDKIVNWSFIWEDFGVNSIDWRNDALHKGEETPNFQIWARNGSKDAWYTMYSNDFSGRYRVIIQYQD